MNLITATIPLFLLGFASQGHCVGMCGPIILALPGQVGTFRAHVLYHLGRLFTYVCAGAVLGGIGEATANALPQMAHAQNWFSLVAGILLLLLGLLRLGVVAEPAWMGGAYFSRLPGLGRVFKAATARNPTAMLAAGLLLGLLPCGLTFGAYSSALATGSTLQGAAFLLAFGLGTLPVLLLLGTGFGAIVRRHRRVADLLSGLLMLGLAARIFYRIQSSLM